MKLFALLQILLSPRYILLTADNINSVFSFLLSPRKENVPQLHHILQHFFLVSATLKSIVLPPFLICYDPIKIFTLLLPLVFVLIPNTYFNCLPSVTRRALGTIKKDDKDVSGRVNTICRLPDSVLLSYFVFLSKILSSRVDFWITARQLHHSYINMHRGEKNFSGDVRPTTMKRLINKELAIIGDTIGKNFSSMN